MKGKTNVGGENVKAEVEYQTPIIAQILEGLVGKAQGANATADKILEGYSAYVGQELIEGTYDPSTADPDLIPSNIREGIDIFGVLGTMVEGVAGIDFGEITLSRYGTITIEHSLGVVPKYLIIVADNVTTTTQTDPIVMVQSSSLMLDYNGGPRYGEYVNAGASCGITTKSNGYATLTETSAVTSISFRNGNYHWVAIA